jgi:altronate dehydratase small subunit
MRSDSIMIREQDNVATALRDIEPMETASVGIGMRSKRILIHERIPYGHKFAVRDIGKGEHIFKNGEIIGRATQEIIAGTHAHIHNIESLRGRGDLVS